MVRHIPFIRLGLLIVIGALFASVITFYLATGRQLADMNAEDISTEPRDLLNHFVNNFLFAGSTAGILFWAGIALCIVGIVRNLTVRSKKITHA